MTEKIIDGTDVAAQESDEISCGDALVNKVSKGEPAAYLVPEVFYREGACFVNVDSGLHSPMSNDAARKDCRENAAIEKALLGTASEQVCKCSISFSEGARLANEGAICSRRCGRDQSAQARHVGRLMNNYISPRPDQYERVVVLSSASSKVGELSTSDLLNVGSEELSENLRRAGITRALGWSTIVTDGRSHSLRAADSALYPKYRIFSQFLARKQELVLGETHLKLVYGQDLMLKPTLPGTTNFKPLDATCAAGYSYGFLEDCVCHMPSRLFGLSPHVDAASGQVSLKDLEAKQLLGLQKIEVAEALARSGLIEQLLLVGVQMVRTDDGFQIVDVDGKSLA